MNESTLVKPTLLWRAVFAGVVMAMIVHTLLNLLTLAWGLSAFQFDSGQLKTVSFTAFFFIVGQQCHGDVCRWLGGRALESSAKRYRWFIARLIKLGVCEFVDLEFDGVCLRYRGQWLG